jgi:hypothetical protein
MTPEQLPYPNRPGIRVPSPRTISAATTLTRLDAGTQNIDTPAAVINDLLAQAEGFKARWQTALGDLEKEQLRAEAVELSLAREIERLNAKVGEQDQVISALGGRVRDLQPWTAATSSNERGAGGADAGFLDDLNDDLDNVSLGEPGGTERDYDGDDDDEDAGNTTRLLSAISGDDSIKLAFPFALEDNGVWRFATEEEMQGNVDLDLVRAQCRRIRKYFYGLWRTSGMSSDGMGEGEGKAGKEEGKVGSVGAVGKMRCGTSQSIRLGNMLNTAMKLV